MELREGTNVEKLKHLAGLRLDLAYKNHPLSRLNNTVKTVDSFPRSKPTYEIDGTGREVAAPHDEPGVVLQHRKHRIAHTAANLHQCPRCLHR